MKKEDLNKKIEYWSKHQELDKFIFNITTSTHIAIISIMSVIFIGVLTYTIMTGYLPTFYITSILVFVVVVVSIIIYFKKTGDSNRAFRIREAMLRVWYQKLKVNTDLLDTQLEEIKKEYKRKMSNKDLENLAKKILKKK